jgi:hypothetical protein
MGNLYAHTHNSRSVSMRDNFNLETWRREASIWKLGEEKL